MPQKREKAEGAPAYMGLFTSLMTVLLAFFIILNSMSDKQESGFHDGIGDIKNAFGLTGGTGIMKFSLFNIGRDAIPVPEELVTETGEEVGFHKDSVSGQGGSGNSPNQLNELNPPDYLRIKLPFDFEEKNLVLNPKIAGFLDLVGIGFGVFKIKFTVRAFSVEYLMDNYDKIEELRTELKKNKADEKKSMEIQKKIVALIKKSRQKDFELASNRALSIINYIHANSLVSFNQMSAVGYADKRYFKLDEPDKLDADLQKQGVFFYIYRKSRAKKQQ